MQNSGNHCHNFFSKYFYSPFHSSARVIFILFSSLLIAPACFAQLNDIGIGIGGFNSTGDLTRKYDLVNERPAATIFFRSNISDAIGIRYGLTGGWLSGKSKNIGDSLSTPVSFNYGLVEGSVLIEYHFLDYKSKSARIHWSPFLFGGAGIFVPLGNFGHDIKYSVVQPVIPLGFGIKYHINPKLDIGAEASTRITFFDYLDKVSDVSNNFRYTNKYNYDVYYFVGITLYYTFYLIPCPYDYD